ncbi:MAG: hypothetical protein KAI29_24255, partial [Cyclobacteriaceae bacterium]|nr:hypothetical protein [Cyclobacteriaceae bacterium]
IVVIEKPGAWDAGGCYLANLCNSTIIGIYGDKIQISQMFRGRQMLEYIAVISNCGSNAISWI